MKIIGSFLEGVFSVMSANVSPQMYRYPYRTSAEALRGDMLRVGKDMDSTLGKCESEQKSDGE
jgi:hypothetical protein